MLASGPGLPAESIARHLGMVLCEHAAELDRAHYWAATATGRALGTSPLRLVRQDLVVVTQAAGNDQFPPSIRRECRRLSLWLGDLVVRGILSETHLWNDADGLCDQDSYQRRTVALTAGARGMGFESCVDMELQQFDTSAREVAHLARRFEAETRDAYLELVHQVVGPREPGSVGQWEVEIEAKANQTGCLEHVSLLRTRGDALLTALGIDPPIHTLEHTEAPVVGGRSYLLGPGDARVKLRGRLGCQLLKCYLHELGHVTYAAGIERSEPIFRTNLGPFGEAMAVLLESLPVWRRDLGGWAPKGPIADSARLLTLHRLRRLACWTSFVLDMHRDPRQDPRAVYRATNERFLPGQARELDSWARIERGGYPAYVPFGFLGSLIAYDLLSTMAGKTPLEIGAMLRAGCFAQGEATSWRAKLLDLTGRPQPSVSAVLAEP